MRITNLTAALKPPRNLWHRRLVLIALLLLSSANPMAQAQEDRLWASSIRDAQQLAQQRHCLVLIHFWDYNCPPCTRVERNVLRSPDVERAMSMNYVPVRVNVTDTAALAEQYNVRQWPTDVFITPDGHEVHRAVSQQDPVRYVSLLDNVAAHARVARRVNEPVQRELPTSSPNGTSNQSNDPALIAQNDQNWEYNRQSRAAGGPRYRGSSGASPLPDDPRLSAPFEGVKETGKQGDKETGRQGAAGLPPSGQNAPDTTDPTNPSNLGTQNGPYRGRTQVPSNSSRFDSGRAGGIPEIPSPQIPNSSPANNDLAKEQDLAAPSESALISNRFVGNERIRVPEIESLPPNPSADDANPPLALDGFCPVTLQEQNRWKKGDPKFGVRHRGRTYLFLSQAEFDRFFANPDRYSPLLSGCDPVLLIETKKWVPGQRQHGIWYEDRMYLFSSEQTLQQFWSQRSRWVPLTEQAMLQTPARRVR